MNIDIHACLSLPAYRRIQACRPCRLHLPQHCHHADALPWYHIQLSLSAALARASQVRRLPELPSFAVCRGWRMPFSLAVLGLERKLCHLIVVLHLLTCKTMTNTSCVISCSYRVASRSSRDSRRYEIRITRIYRDSGRPASVGTVYTRTNYCLCM